MAEATKRLRKHAGKEVAYNYSVFYRPTDTTIDVVRVLHHFSGHSFAPRRSLSDVPDG
jgi:hypothetical protein